MRYIAFVDPSGGSADSMTLTIAHGEIEGKEWVPVLDAVGEVRSPGTATKALLAVPLDDALLVAIPGEASCLHAKLVLNVWQRPPNDGRSVTYFLDRGLCAGM